VQPLEGLDQIPSHCAANAAIHHLDNIFIGILRKSFFINPDFAELVLDDCKAQSVVRAIEDVVQESGLA
jgi:hypothetical protein